MVRRRLFALTAKQVEKTTAPGYYSDGAGLTLQVLPTGAKTWIYRFMLNGRAREMGLGGVATFTLAEARERARAARQLVQDGIDPIEARKDAVRQRQAVDAKQLTFNDAASRYIASQEAGWRNAKHSYQWRSTIENFASPFIGGMRVSAIGTEEIMRVMSPIWVSKNETAQRLRGRIENILDWCRVQGFCSGENPARWRGHLDKLLPKPSKITQVENHPALPWQQMPAFMQALRERPGSSARALEFIILTAARSGEARGATWAEIDLDDRVWHVPGNRMKAGRPHDVPLSDAAVQVLETIRTDGDSGLIFKGRKDAELSDMSVLAVIRRMNSPEPVWKDRDGRPALVHGMRASFRMWAAEATTYPREVAEHALAHQLPDRVEAAYQRSTQFEKRRALMADWGTFCTSEGKTV
ncbi:site-specific integrase [uncultured Comamonas sp.]|uniref:tyrosine-type recombinase/integrase n=1 Tax=uncultured Comamonas sp. TaxID=114710 RepID=UPI00262F84B3|nr:site-specific integrase [uncultured Comamonas sp.]